METASNIYERAKAFLQKNNPEQQTVALDHKIDEERSEKIRTAQIQEEALKQAIGSAEEVGSGEDQRLTKFGISRRTFDQITDLWVYRIIFFELENPKRSFLRIQARDGQLSMLHTQDDKVIATSSDHIEIEAGSQVRTASSASKGGIWSLDIFIRKNGKSSSYRLLDRPDPLETQMRALLDTVTINGLVFPKSEQWILTPEREGKFTWISKNYRIEWHRESDGTLMIDSLIEYKTPRGLRKKDWYTVELKKRDDTSFQSPDYPRDSIEGLLRKIDTMNLSEFLEIHVDTVSGFLIKDADNTVITRIDGTGKWEIGKSGELIIDTGGSGRYEFSRILRSSSTLWDKLGTWTAPSRITYPLVSGSPPVDTLKFWKWLSASWEYVRFLSENTYIYQRNERGILRKNLETQALEQYDPKKQEWQIVRTQKAPNI